MAMATVFGVQLELEPALQSRARHLCVISPRSDIIVRKMRKEGEMLQNRSTVVSR